MNDWSYACVAKVLSIAIAEAATRPVASAAARAPALISAAGQGGQQVLDQIVRMFQPG